MENKDRKIYDALANFRMYKFVLWILFSFFLGVFVFYVLDRCDVLPPHANRCVVPDEILTRKDAYELFDKQFTHLLTTLGILLSVFGIALPIISYFFQRVSLRDEREAIQHEIEIGLANIKERENNLEKELKKVNETEIKISEIKKEFEIVKKDVSGTFALSFEALASAHASNINIYANDPNNKRIAIINYIAMTVNAITRHCEAGNIEMARNLIMRLYDKQSDLGDVGKLDELTIKEVESLKTVLGAIYYDKFKTVYNKYFVQQLP